MIEITDKFVKDNLDYEGYIAYEKGSDSFKKAVKLGLVLQLAQVNVALKKLDRFKTQNDKSTRI